MHRTLAHVNGEWFFVMHRTLANTNGGWFFAMHCARWRIPMDGGFINGDGNPQMEATAEGRLYNHSPRLACLPGVSCGRINL